MCEARHGYSVLDTSAGIDRGLENVEGRGRTDEEGGRGSVLREAEKYQQQPRVTLLRATVLNAMSAVNSRALQPQPVLTTPPRLLKSRFGSR